MFEDGFWGNLKEAGDPLYKSELAQNPMGRMATPEEVAKPTVFLARYDYRELDTPSSDLLIFFFFSFLFRISYSPAASYTSGTNLRVDGARTRGVQL
jgi:3-oxoacyl-[acyl-carrier protein] reductase